MRQPLAPLGDEPLPAEDEPPPSVRIARGVKARAATLRTTLAAASAWVITVAPLVVSGRASVMGRVLALLAVVPGVVGPQLIERNHKMARHVGVSAYLGFVLLAWSWASKDQVLATVDVFRALLGVIAWAVFAVSWSHPWSVPVGDLKSAPEGDTRGLKPRRRPAPYAVGVAVAGAVFGLSCLALAWRIEDVNRAVFGQAVAVGCAIALITSASTIAVLAGKDKRRDGRKARLPIDRKVLNSMLAMLLFGALAVAVYLTRQG
jgi:hypothetical protein